VVQEFLDHTTPSAPVKGGFAAFLNVAATPPPAEEGSPSLEPVPRLGLRVNLIRNLGITESIESRPTKALEMKRPVRLSQALTTPSWKSRSVLQHPATQGADQKPQLGHH